MWLRLGNFCNPSGADELQVLVFGAAGFVGRNLIETLTKSEDEIVASDTVDDPFGGALSYMKADLLDRNRITDSVKDARVIVHLAASSLVASLQDPIGNMKINLEGTLNILEAARKHDVKKVIYSSASSVVGTPRYNPVDEDHPCNPKTPYAVTKKACEDYIRVYNELYGLQYLVFRFFNVYGPWQSHKSGALIPTLYKILAEGSEFQVYGDGSSTRDFIYVEDLVEYLSLAIKGQVDNTTVNLGTGLGTSIVQLIELGSGLLGVKPRIAFKPSRPGEIGNFVADTRRLIELFGRRPTTSLEEGLKRSFAWLQAHQSS